MDDKDKEHEEPVQLDRDQEELLKPTTFQLYKTIDYSTNVFSGEVDGEKKTFLGHEYANVLFLIEEFVEWCIKGKPLQPLAKARADLESLLYDRYYEYMNKFISTYSVSKIYSPRVELFFETCLVKHGLGPGDFDKDPQLYSDKFKRTNGEFFDRLIQEILNAASTREFKRKVYARTEAINRGYSSAKKYIDSWFERCSRLLVLRIDFGFLAPDPDLQHPVDLTEAQRHFARFLNNKRSKTLYSHLKGYIWRLEYGKQKGYHWHIFFLFDGSKVRHDGYFANEIGKDWEKVTDGKGIFHNCNLNKKKYERIKRLGIGMISHDDEDKRRNLLGAVAYMYKEDQTLREKHTKKTHTWGRGEMPKPRQGSLGRPRRGTGIDRL